MTDVFKKIAFLEPKPGLTRAEFLAHWRTVHGPLVASAPDYGRWRTRYAQNHIIGAGPFGRLPSFGGMAEFQLPGASPNEDRYATTSTYRDHIAPDERNFIDMDRTISFSARETVVRNGFGASKLLLLTDTPETPDSDLIEVALDQPDFASRLRGWTISPAIEGSFRAPGARQVGGLPFSCVHAIWFDTSADAGLAFGTQASRRVWDPIVVHDFFAEELVFFNDGEPVRR